MSQAKVFVQLSSHGVRFEAGLNGGVLARGTEEEQHSTFTAADHWVLPEDNALTAHVSPGEGETPRHASVTLALFDSSTPEDDALARFSWVYDGEPFQPFDLRIPIVPPRIPTSLVWPKSAVHETIDEALRADVTTAALELVQAFERQELDRILDDLCVLRTEDLAGVLGNDLARYQARLRTAHEGLLSSGTVRAVKPEELRLQLVAGGRAVRVRAGERELIETEDAQVPVYFGLVDGRWRVVR